MAIGTTGFAAAVTLLMVLAPASAGTVSHATVLTPAYTHTVSQAGSSLSIYGCAKAKVTPAKWTPSTGSVTTAGSSSASTCGKSLGYVGGSSSGGAFGEMLVAIPFHAAHSGTDAIASTWTVNIASTSSYTASGCPAKNINYHPTLNSYSYAYCEAGTNSEFELFSYVYDLQNSSWYGNTSYGYTYNESYFENYTECFNYGTPTCYNYSSSSYHYAYSYNAAGFNAFTMNGATTFTLWNNGTNMVRAHHYYLEVELYVDSGAFAEQANLLGPWSASAASSVNMATLGNGATLSSISIT